MHYYSKFDDDLTSLLEKIISFSLRRSWTRKFSYTRRTETWGDMDSATWEFYLLFGEPGHHGKRDVW
uniref:Uncharacterized protein n=1 Tax=Romanomermis culicivorax TaxID=13658 RepID=A0A915HZ80_ROMCU